VSTLSEKLPSETIKKSLCFSAKIYKGQCKNLQFAEGKDTYISQSRLPWTEDDLNKLRKMILFGESKKVIEAELKRDWLKISSKI
jgi:hypothetical protein